MSDYRVKVTVRNARLLRAIESLGHTPSSFANANGFQPGELCGLVAMTRRPLLRNGDFRACVLALCEQANVMPCDLFNARQLEGIDVNSAEIEVSSRELSAYAPAEIENPEDGYMRQEIAARVSGLLSRLPERAQLAMRMHADGATLDEIGAEIGASRERARQLIEKSKRRIRDATRSTPGLRFLTDSNAEGAL